MQLKAVASVRALMLVTALACAAAKYEPSTLLPPQPEREFRGLWVATVGNIDWPSKPGLSTARQKAELLAILDRAAQLKLNAIIFQVRPACDAFYASRIEPWSEYLTGVMGQPPEPFYDPLAFAIEEAHKRGLELHAWFNPYRALHKSHEGRVSANHISKTRPDLVRHYGQYLWLDPGERDVQDYSLSVVMDVVRRYDIDGVHFDDYFYPDRAESPTRAAFPDEASWRKYGAGGSLALDDWRRENVNAFIQRVYHSIKSVKPWVKFGISPLGIWRPGNPPQVRKGFDSYATIYADSRKWLANGWLDYFSPQLYWPIEPKELSFPALLEWWSAQNVKHRHLWPGLSAAYALAKSWPVEEIPNQIRITRRQGGTDGYMFYSARALFANTALTDALGRDLQSHCALVPASPWLGNAAPGAPAVSVAGNGSGLTLNWRAATNSAVRWWLIQTKTFDDWRTDILPAQASSTLLDSALEVIAVTAVDRFGNASSPRVLQLRKEAPPKKEKPPKERPPRTAKRPVRKW